MCVICSETYEEADNYIADFNTGESTVRRRDPTQKQQNWRKMSNKDNSSDE